ncbi:MAG TPA: S8 family serine peptidase, partial [Candidatus Limnocylindria bacterium]|nr:S8 family serine peptidase [Candidatus Limnocylindria bacterium]
MKRRMWLAAALGALLWATPARADNRIILRTRLSLQALQTACNPLLLAPICTVVGGLGDPLGQVFLITSPLDVSGLLGLLGNPLGIINAELDQLLNLVGGLNILPTPIPATVMSDRTLVPYPAGSTTNAWDGYVNQPAASIVGVQDTQKTFSVLGTGIVADIDTGVDPTHPALQGVLLQGYDFTRNQPGGSELNDTSPCPFMTCPPPPCPNCSPAKVNQSTAAVLDQSTAAVLDGTPYAAFGHGTMVMGIIHLVAPTAQLLPLKAFHSDGTASLSDILRAIYYGVQNGANVINMSFDITTPSTELQNALDSANQSGVICAASAGNDGKAEIVYPAFLQSDVMGVASTTDQDARSSFSNFGINIVWVAAPGEAIVSTYPYNTYAAGWGTSFSAPFVSGGAALLHNVNAAISQSGAAAAVANAVPLDPNLGLNHGRLDLCATLASVTAASCSPDFSVSAAPPSATITAGQQANFTVSATPLHGSTQTVTWSCTGAPAAATCTVSPSSVTLNGSTMATATVTLTTMARVLAPPLVLPRYSPPMSTWVMLAACFAGLAVLLLFCTLSRALPKRPGLAAAAGLLVLSLFTYACGGSYGGPPGSPTLSSIALNPTSVTGGSPSTGTVSLSGPAPSGGAAVSLSSDNTTAATVPASVTVTAGASSATFTVSTSSVTTSTSVNISASYAGVTKTASLTVLPQAPPTLSSLTLNPTSVTGGAQTSTGTVTLSGPALTGGAAVSLSSSSTSTATVPASVTVAAGASSATFTVSTSAVTASTPVTISASYAGVTKTASLTVVSQALPTLSSLTLNPTSVTGGSPSTGTVTLSGPALTGGAQVLLSSNNGAASVSASVTIAAGASSATFTVSTSAVTASTPVTISASYAGVTKTASLTVLPQALPTLSSLTLNPASVTGGAQTSTGTVTLSGPAPSGGIAVSLSSSTSTATVPASVTVVSGASSATFTVSTSAVTASTPVTISASYAGVTKTASLTVLPQAPPTLSSLTLNPTSVTGGVQSSTGTVTLSGPALTGGA